MDRLDRIECTLIAVWGLSYLMPLFLFFAPLLGLPPRPGHPRTIQICIAICLTAFLTIWNARTFSRHRKYRETVRQIRARGGIV